MNKVFLVDDDKLFGESLKILLTHVDEICFAG